MRDLIKWITLKELEEDDEYILRLATKMLNENKKNTTLSFQVGYGVGASFKNAIDKLDSTLDDMFEGRVELVEKSNLDKDAIEIEIGSSFYKADIKEQLAVLDQLFLGSSEDLMIIDFNSIYQKKSSLKPYREEGKVLETKGMVYKVSLSTASQGSRVTFLNEDGNRYYGEVVSISTDSCFVMPYQDVLGVNSRTKVFCNYDSNEITVCHELLGRVVDAFGKPLDGKGHIKSNYSYTKSLIGEQINPLERPY